jgi:hypothetical protein
MRAKKPPLLDPGRLQADRLSEGDELGGKTEFIWRRVEDNAFHQLELSALFRFR